MSKTTSKSATTTPITTPIVRLSTTEQSTLKGGIMAYTCEEKRPKIRH